MHVTVSVTLRDGTTHTERCDRPPGTWGAPIDPAMHRAKVRSCLGVRLRREDVDRAVAIIDRLEDADADDIEDLMRLLRNCNDESAG